ncbi:MAG: hypothetical protein ACRCX2_18545 [Paraclostridium sp.]
MGEEISGIKTKEDLEAKILQIRANGIKAAYNQLMADPTNPLYIYLIFMMDPEMCSEKCGNGGDKCTHRKICGVHCHSSMMKVPLNEFERFSCEQYSIDRDMNLTLLNVIFDRQYAILLMDDNFYKEELEKHNKILLSTQRGTNEFNHVKYILKGIDNTRKYAVMLSKRNEVN